MNTVFYNEHDPYPAQWLVNLIKAGHIQGDVVSTQNVQELVPSDVRGWTRAHFFAGIGGWEYALQLAGWPTDMPVWTGSCPCQPFSAAGRRKGLNDARHLWPTWFTLIDACHPPFVFGEQVASPDGLHWFDTVSTDLEDADYTVEAVDLCAAGVGAPHIRQRLYFVAISNRQRCTQFDTLLYKRRPHQNRIETPWGGANASDGADGYRRFVKPGTFPLAHGVSARVGRLRAYGNAIVPQVAATFIRAVMDTLNFSIDTLPRGA